MDYVRNRRGVVIHPELNILNGTSDAGLHMLGRINPNNLPDVSIGHR